MTYFKECKHSFCPNNDKVNLLLQPKKYMIVYKGEIDNETKLPNGHGIQFSRGRVNYKSKKESLDGTSYYYGARCRAGYWIQGKLTGEGYQWYKNRMMYKGRFYEDKPDGYGTFYNAKKEVDQAGTWKVGNMYNGYGTIFYEDKTRYKGDVIDGMRWGFGILYDSEGKEQTIGRWFKNHIDEGTLTAPLQQ